jgi:hypothetical protein
VTTLKLFDNLSRKTDILPKLGYGLFWLVLFVVSLGAGQNAYAVECVETGDEANTITANVVVFDSPTVFNRLGAQNPNWITYALRRDVVVKSGPDAGTPLNLIAGSIGSYKGNVELRRDKRPRPLVIRSVAEQCLKVVFTNLLDDSANPNDPQQGVDTPGTLEPALGPFPGLDNNDQVRGRQASFHATGTELVGTMADDGSWVGKNLNSTVGPGGEATYMLHTPHEGAFIIKSYGATIGSESNSGNLAVGMFGALNVQPKGARLYRSQVTEEELRLATVGTVPTSCTGAEGEISGVDCNPGGQPIIDYDAVYPRFEDDGVTETVWVDEGKADLPILRMVTGADGRTGELVHSDINAIIAGPDADGTWNSVCNGTDNPACPYPLERKGYMNPVYPNRTEAYREFTSQYHDEQTNSQVFPNWYNNPVMRHVLHGVKDQFMINYGSGGIRLRTGPMYDCTDCAYEEFFLASQTVGDPALLVKYPANTNIEACSPEDISAGPGADNACWRLPTLANGPVQFPNPACEKPDPDGDALKCLDGLDPATANVIPAFVLADNYALYQEDPSNVHHAYTGDFVKMRNTHSGAFEQHIFHFHNHQWLFNPNDPDANYLDAQEIMPGSGHTYELVNGGAGNRNHTVGDAIFHCHFYPHFAQGMWYHMRNHDVFETGTVLAVSNTDADNPTGYHSNPFDLESGKPMAGARAYPDGELPHGTPIPAVVPLPGKPMPQMPAKVEIVAVDRGANSLLGGRTGPDGMPDSSQAIVDITDAIGPDLTAGTADDKSPGYPFFLAGNECGVDLIGFTMPDDDPVKGRVVAGADCPNGIAGQRMPTPPLDMLTESGATALGYNSNQAGGWDGGLPRHALLGYTSGGLSLDTQNRLDFRKIVEMAPPVYFPEGGTDLEKVSMAYQAVRHRPSVAYKLDKDQYGNPDPVDRNPNNPATFAFVLNGAPAVPGGAYNDPCVDDTGTPLEYPNAGQWYSSRLPSSDEDRWDTLDTEGVSPFDGANPRTYKIANLQIDAVFNKVGYHYPQERIIILWEDVEPTIKKIRPPEPLVMRFNTFDCGKLLHANLVPHEFELDDFQVRTPTDIIGQHIHLPKWDLTTNDGAANGWNYEDGTLAPGIVVERIHAIDKFNLKVGTVVGPNCTLAAALEGDTTACPIPGQLAPIDLRDYCTEHDANGDCIGDPIPVATLPNPCNNTDQLCGTPGDLTDLTEQGHPFFGDGLLGQDYLGARTTIQRLLVDPIVNVAGVDRGLGLTFSHDHYGPSTFQQVGLYSTILAEPAGSTWVHNESGTPLFGATFNPDGSVKDIAGSRGDGGPTSWQAAILTPTTSTVGSDEIPNHREFYFEMSDFQHAYEAGVYVGANASGVPVRQEDDPLTEDIEGIIQPNPFNATVAYLGEPVAGADDLRHTWLQAVNPTLKLTANGGINPGAFPDTVNAHPGCPGRAGQNDSDVPRPCAEAINIGHSSMWVVNFRNEPIGLRVFDPNERGPDDRDGRQAFGDAGDLALAFQTRSDRAISELNKSVGLAPYPQPEYCQGGGDGKGGKGGKKGGGGQTDGPASQSGDGINCDRRNGDPFTPTMRAYMHDDVKVKIQVGATEEQHQTTIHGFKWLSNGSGFGRSPNSGWRNFQSHGISEQFSLQVPITENPQAPNDPTDYLYATDATRDGIWSGTWGILRAYPNQQQDLYQLPNNPQGAGIKIINENQFSGVCPNTAPTVQIDVAAVLANKVLSGGGGAIPANTNPVDNVGGPLDTQGGTLVYNSRTTQIAGAGCDDGGDPPNPVPCAGPLHDPTAMMYVRLDDLEPRLIAGVSPDAYGNKQIDVDIDGNPKYADSADYEEGDGVDDRCQEQIASYGQDPYDMPYDENLGLEGCPVQIKAGVPIEPLVLRAKAGDCIDVTLHNKLVDQATYYGKPVYEYQCLEWVDPDPLIEGDEYCGNEEWFGAFDRGQAEGAVAAGYMLRTKDEPATEIDLADEYLKFEAVPDLAGWQDTFWVVNRDQFKPIEERRAETPAPQMRFFGNNLIAPSAKVGLVAQLVKYDSNADDGVVVGLNSADSLAHPGGKHTYRYYAGDLRQQFVGIQGNRKNFELVATPIEFGGSNLLSADRIKQPQKGLFGALVIEPAGTTDVSEDPDMRAQATVTAGSESFREAVLIAHKIGNLRWADGSEVKNVAQAQFGVEGAEDSGHAGFNYRMEPAWFRFGLPPDADFGHAGAAGSYGDIPNPEAMYANSLVGGDPETPVFTAAPGEAVRMYVLNGASADRDSTFILHGHLWQRDPFICPNEQYLGLAGYCEPYLLDENGEVLTDFSGIKIPAVGSLALGNNPVGKWMGSEEGMGHVFGHWPILINAGGENEVTGDYLYRDYAPNGNRNGMFGILRVE